MKIINKHSCTEDKLIDTGIHQLIISSDKSGICSSLHIDEKYKEIGFIIVVRLTP